MKLSLNWAKQFTDIDLTVDELVERINVRLGATEGVSSLAEKYKGIVVARVVDCSPHPNADKLSVCLIDDGGVTDGVNRDSRGYIQVVCGASNVVKDLLVAWIPPGYTVPNTLSELEPAVLDNRNIRGQDSSGMLASAKELDFSDDHSRIIEIDKQARPGQSFAELYELDDYIIEIENKMFTNRPDCFGILGLAREIAGISEISFTSPDWYKQALPIESAARLKVNIDNQLKQKVPRISLIALDNISVAPSNLQLQSYLSRVGVKPINNVVDVTNFMSYLTAQPMHAFDFDKLANGDEANIVIRSGQKSDKLTLLDGKTIEPGSEDILICNQERPLSLAGVMGGMDSQVDQNTTRILLETASFNLYAIRRSSMRHGLFTDAVTRFSKGQPSAQVKPVAAKAIKMLIDNTRGKVASTFVDKNSSPETSREVEITNQFINQRLGTGFSSQAITDILNRTEFEVVSQEETIKVKVPFWRSDISIREDLVEEVGRLYGFDKIDLTLPLRDIGPSRSDIGMAWSSEARTKLAQAGANEVMTHAFVSEKLMNSTQQEVNQAHQIRNAISPDLNFYRMTLLPSLLDRVHLNHKAGYENFALFEISKLHNKVELDTDGLPLERRVVSLVFSKDSKDIAEHIGAPYYHAKKFLDYLLSGKDTNVTYKPLTDVKIDDNLAWQANVAKLFLPQRSAQVICDNQVIGYVGEIINQTKKVHKLPKFVAGFEIDLDLVGQLADKSVYAHASKYPSITQDMTYEVNTSVDYAEINNAIMQHLNKINFNHNLRLLDIFKPEADKVKRYTFRLSLSHDNRTLSSQETKEIIAELNKQLKSKIKAQQI